MMRIIHFCTAIAIAIIVVGINTPLAHADSFSASASVVVPGCSQSATLSEPGNIDISCGPIPSGTVFGTLGRNSGDIHYLINPNATSNNGMVSGEVNSAGEIMAPGNSGTSTITFEFQGSESQNGPIGCVLIFDGETTGCSPTGAAFGQVWTDDLEFVVQNGQSYNFDLEVGFEAPLLAGIPIDGNFKYLLPADVVPEPVPEPVSLILLLSGFAPLAFKRKG
jgi:hypothetical protein